MHPTPYSGFSFRAKLYLWAVILAAAGLAAGVLAAAGAGLPAALGVDRPSSVLTSLVTTAAIVAAGLYPIRLGLKLRTSVTSTFVFAAALLFPVPQVMFITAVGALAYRLANVLSGRSPRVPGWLLTDTAFNTAQITLTATVTSMLFHRLGPSVAALLQLQSIVAFWAVLSAMALCFAVNTLIVSTMSALVLNHSVLGTWKQTFGRRWHLSTSALLLGVAVAIVYLYAPAGVVLVIIPLIAIHQAFSVSITIQNQARETLETLADAIDKRDPYTYEHSQRVALYAQLAAHRLGLTEDEQEGISLAARVHDLGKMGVREHLLKKPDRLTPAELEEVRRHTLIGADIVSKLADYARSREAILYHHEWWDGSGIYRLAYDHIPMGARIIAVADAFDAMTSDRAYRQALPEEQAFAELQKGKGTQFDPVVVEAFIDAVRGKTLTPPRMLAAEADVAPPSAPSPHIRH